MPDPPTHASPCAYKHAFSNVGRWQSASASVHDRGECQASHTASLCGRNLERSVYHLAGGHSKLSFECRQRARCGDPLRSAASPCSEVLPLQERFDAYVEGGIDSSSLAPFNMNWVQHAMEQAGARHRL
eukprot:6211903-Pleurochrysis_carterae.AAC.5